MARKVYGDMSILSPRCFSADHEDVGGSIKDHWHCRRGQMCELHRTKAEAEECDRQHRGRQE